MRIWVTGVGIVSPLGAGASTTMTRLCRGEHAFSEVTLFDVAGQRSRIAAQVHDVCVRDVAPAGMAASWSRTDALAVVAAREALGMAKLDPASEGVDLVVGSTTGASFETEPRLLDLPSLPPSPDRMSSTVVEPLAVAVDNLVLALGPFRRTRLVSSACSTGANALMLAASWIRAGFSNSVLAGASDTLCRLTFTGFNALGSLDPEPCRPFDRSRAGLSLGEAAAFLVLERDDVARARGAVPLVELVGWAAGAEAHHITNPEAEGTTATRIMRDAMLRAGLAPDDIDYVNAHGTATLLNDTMEVRAVREALGDAFDRVAISSIKGQVGHSLGAAGAIEGAITALAVAEGRVPPTGGLRDIGEGCEANHVIGVAREAPLRAALSNSFGFGGLDACLAFAQPGYAPQPSASAARRVLIRAGAITGRDGVAVLTRETLQTEPTSRGPIAFDPATLLEAPRARRLARAEKLLASVVEAIRQDSDVQALLDGARPVGLIAAKPSGNPDASSRFLDRVRQKGPRFAAPADFPNLMLSALAGHVSIYHRLHGSVLATAARGVGGAAALQTAWDLMQGGCDSPFVAGAAEAWGMAAEDDALRLAQDGSSAFRSEGAACLLLAHDDPSCRAGLASILHITAWHDDRSKVASLEEMPSPVGSAVVLTTGQVAPDLLAGTSWADAPVRNIESTYGVHDATSLAAAVHGASLIASGDADRVLVIASGAVVTIVIALAPP